MTDKEVSHPLIYPPLPGNTLTLSPPVILAHKALCVHPAHGGLHE